MASDQVAVHQDPIKMLVGGEGVFKTTRQILVPEPPANCESQQIFDWAAVTSGMRNQHMQISGHMRMVEAYAERWGISVEEISTLDAPGDLG